MAKKTFDPDEFIPQEEVQKETVVTEKNPEAGEVKPFVDTIKEQPKVEVEQPKPTPARVLPKDLTLCALKPSYIAEVLEGKRPLSITLQGHEFVFAPPTYEAAIPTKYAEQYDSSPISAIAIKKK